MAKADTGSLPNAAAIRDIMTANDDVLEMFFAMFAGGEFWDGGVYRLYFDLDSRDIVYRKARPGETFPERGENRLRLLHQVHEKREVDAEALFNPDNDCMSLDNFGYREWREEIAAAIKQELSCGFRPSESRGR